MSDCGGDNDKEKCKGFDGFKQPPKPDVCDGGLFGGLFGGGGGNAASGCNTCGKANCNCNCELKNHLTECCDLGKRPPLIEKCADIPGPGYRDTVYRSTCGDKCGGDKKPEKPKCGCEQKKDDCEKPKDNCSKCPPMPETDCCNCKPGWLKCPPPCADKKYSVPKGVQIIPISEGGRRGGGGGTCGKCGQGKAEKPNVSNPKCPMIKPKCPGTEDKDSGGGFMAKIASLFGKK